ncbi:MAG: ZIP family metal transporter [Eubacteriaceae bacterium]|jgi:ZIP family zinc transporter|nr:ZIP family metal transporter [Eubacteriaceae bacterium]
MNTSALLATLFLGVFVLIGVFAVYATRNNDKLLRFTIGASCSVMCLLVAVEIFPEALEISISHLREPGGIVHVGIFTLVGITLLAILDRFMPEHSHAGDSSRFAHIGVISSIAIVIHNIVEGAGVYAVYASSSSLGAIMSVSVGLHNIPLGMMVASAFYGKKESLLQRGAILFSLSVSSFIGGLAVHFLKLDLGESLLASALLSASCGMLLFIVFMELLPEVKEHIKEKEIGWGLAFGAALFIGGMLLT